MLTSRMQRFEQKACDWCAGDLQPRLHICSRSGFRLVLLLAEASAHCRPKRSSNTLNSGGLAKQRQGCGLCNASLCKDPFNVLLQTKEKKSSRIMVLDLEITASVVLPSSCCSHRCQHELSYRTWEVLNARAITAPNAQARQTRRIRSHLIWVHSLVLEYAITFSNDEIDFIFSPVF